MRIYLTHCSREKSPAAKTSGLPLPPDELYTEPGIQQFMTACKSKGVNWAILSDNYGVFLPTEKHEYYEKPPATVTPEEEAVIAAQFNQRLSGYDEIWFFVRPETFHPFYDRVLKSISNHKTVTVFTELEEILPEISMKTPTSPGKKDYLQSVLYLALYVLTIGGTAFLLLPKLWYLWGIIVLIGMLLLVNWHKQKTIYCCPSCGHVYEISFLTDLLAPHGVNRDGGWLLLRCPNCHQRSKTTVLKKE